MAQVGVTSFATPAQRGGPLDLLRFAAAIFIVLYHYAAAAPVDVTRLHPALTRGYLATDFFLMLSGYVLAKGYGRRLQEGRTTAVEVVTRRLRRIWPGHAVMMVTFLVFVLAAAAIGQAPNRPMDYQPADFLAQLFLVQAWGAPVGTGWNFPTWSLSALFVCYAAFPFAWRLAARAPAAGVAAVGLLLVMAADAWAEAALGGPMFQLPYFLGVVRALPLFLFGLGLARVTDDLPLPRGWAGPVGILALTGLVALQAVVRSDLVSMALIGLVIVACGSVRQPRGSKVVAYLAQLSFSLFLTHILTSAIWFNVTERLFDGAPVGLRWAAWAASIPAALAVAALFHHLIDQPLQSAIAMIVRNGRERRAAPRSAAKQPAG